MATISSAHVRTIRELFSESSDTVRVPTSIQRQYAWEGEAETFYRDIRKFAHEAGKTEHYFMGSILTVIRDKSSYRDLIDGQQRLATTTILLAAMRDALFKLGSHLAPQIQENFIAYQLEETDPVKYYLELTNFDKAYFQNHIQDWDANTGVCPATRPDKTPSNRLIAAAKKRFDTNIAEDLKGLSPQEKLAFLKRMRTVIVRQIQFVEVVTPSEDDANEIFELINDRGMRLSPLDLLRNFLLTEANAQERNKIDDGWDIILQRAKDAPELGQFLRHYWISTHGDVRARGLYKEVKSSLQEAFKARAKDSTTGTSPSEFVSDLAGASETYFNLRRAESDDSKLKDSLIEIADLGAQPLYPVLLSAVKRYGDKASAPLAATLISFYARWSIIGRKESTLLETIMFGLAKQLGDGTATIDQAIEELRAKDGGDGALGQAFRKVSVNRQTWRRHVLVRLEDAIRRSQGKSELKVGSPKSVHVEHIYPQNPEDEYRLRNSQGESIHKDWVNRIGNLTLLQGSKNIAGSNSPLPIKLQNAYGDTEIQLTLGTDVKGLWDNAEQQWSEKGIERRQAELAKYAASAWPL